MTGISSMSTRAASRMAWAGQRATTETASGADVRPAALLWRRASLPMSMRVMIVRPTVAVATQSSAAPAATHRATLNSSGAKGSKRAKTWLARATGSAELSARSSASSSIRMGRTRPQAASSSPSTPRPKLQRQSNSMASRPGVRHTRCNASRLARALMRKAYRVCRPAFATKSSRRSLAR